MRLEFDNDGYVCCVLYGCTTGSCTEYTGLIPNEPETFEDIDDWANRAQTQAYKLNDLGNLVYDAERAASLCDEDELICKKYTNNQIKEMGIFDAIYPVGSLYISVNDVSPATLFGGTWEKIEDRFLLAASTTYSAGTTGGSQEHQHTSPNGYNSSNKLLGMSFRQGSIETSINGAYAALSQTVTTGSGVYNWKLPKTDNVSHMPPYLAVYMWKRVADPIPENYQNFIDINSDTFMTSDENEFMVEVE